MLRRCGPYRTFRVPGCLCALWLACFINPISAEASKTGIDDAPPSPGIPETNDLRAASHSDSVKRSLLSRWRDVTPDIAEWTRTCEGYADRRLKRVFPLTTFYRLIARHEDEFAEITKYGCESLGVLLLLPDEINLLLILENRKVNRQNVQSLAEIIVRMADPEGATTMTVVSKKTNLHPETQRVSRVVLETRSRLSGMHKRWSLDLRFDRFYSLEEKLVRYRPPEGFGPELDGPVTGDEIYTVFWRAPEERARMRQIRREWLEKRHPEKNP